MSLDEVSGHQGGGPFLADVTNWWPRPHIAFGVIPTTVEVITDYSQDEICDLFVSRRSTLRVNAGVDAKLGARRGHLAAAPSDPWAAAAGTPAGHRPHRTREARIPTRSGFPPVRPGAP